MTTTHYLITKNKEAIGVTAADEADAMAQAEAMGIASTIARVDVAMSEEEWNAAVSGDAVSLNDAIRTAVAALPVKTAEKMAKAVYAVLVKAAKAEGQKPELEVSIKKPGEPRHFNDATCWCVAWEAGPHEWAIPASFAIIEASGKTVEPYYSFDLCFYPSQDRA